MWPFTRAATVEELKGYKRVRIKGMRFVIRRLNPLLDFESDKIPTIFTAAHPRRGANKTPPPVTPEAAARAEQDMYAIIAAGVVEPALSPDGLTPKDLFRDMQIGTGLYIEIVAHSLNVFRGLKGLFFFHRIKLLLWMRWLHDMADLRRRQSSEKITA